MAPGRSAADGSSAPYPATLVPLALAVAARKRISAEWRTLTTAPHRLLRARTLKLVATPRDFRPTDPDAGRAILSGRFVLAGAELQAGDGGDPWDRPSPSRRFAVELHRFSFAPHLAACGAAGAQETLRLFLDWRRMFSRPNAFAWGAEVMERRVFNLACAARRMSAAASEVETAELFGSLQQQAQHLLRLDADPTRAAQRTAAAAIVGAALTGKASEALLVDGLKRLGQALDEAVLPDGGHRTRSPQAALELLFDLLTLDDLLLQRGREAPPAMVSALDRLSAAVRFHTLADGRLASFHGGEAVEADRVAAALSDEGDPDPPPQSAPHSGYHRLAGRTLQVMVDAAAPAQGAWSVTACAQPLALEVVAGTDRLLANGGWSPDATGPQALRLTAAGDTATVEGGSAGWPLTGFLARALGPRLYGAAREVKVGRDQNESGVWLELSHDGWLRTLGLAHERRLFVDGTIDEMRGEDVLVPVDPNKASRMLRAFTVRFHVFPGVQASLARDGRSVLLRGPSDRGWWFRNDAPQVSLEPSVCFLGGQPRRTLQVVLQGAMRPGDSARVRWKLAPVEPLAPRPKTSKTQAAAEAPEMLAPEAPA